MSFASFHTLRHALRPSPAAWGVLLLCAQWGHGAQAQPLLADEDERINLKLDLDQLGHAPSGQAAQLLHLEADSLEGAVGQSVVLRGNAQLRSSSAIVKADALEFRQAENRALA